MLNFCTKYFLCFSFDEIDISQLCLHDNVGPSWQRVEVLKNLFPGGNQSAIISFGWIRPHFFLFSVPVFGASCSFSSSIQPFLLSCTGCLPMQVKQWKKCIYLILTWQLFAVKAQEARTEKNPGAEEELLQTLETSRTRQDPNLLYTQFWWTRGLAAL